MIFDEQPPDIAFKPPIVRDLDRWKMGFYASFSTTLEREVYKDFCTIREKHTSV